jgi:hypothetical protein
MKIILISILLGLWIFLFTKIPDKHVLTLDRITAYYFMFPKREMLYKDIIDISYLEVGRWRESTVVIKDKSNKTIGVYCRNEMEARNLIDWLEKSIRI